MSYLYNLFMRSFYYNNKKKFESIPIEDNLRIRDCFSLNYNQKINLLNNKEMERNLITDRSEDTGNSLTFFLNNEKFQQILLILIFILLISIFIYILSTNDNFNINKDEINTSFSKEYIYSLINDIIDNSIEKKTLNLNKIEKLEENFNIFINDLKNGVYDEAPIKYLIEIIDDIIKNT